MQIVVNTCDTGWFPLGLQSSHEKDAALAPELFYS